MPPAITPKKRAMMIRPANDDPAGQYERSRCITHDRLPWVARLVSPQPPHGKEYSFSESATRWRGRQLDDRAWNPVVEPPYPDAVLPLFRTSLSRPLPLLLQDVQASVPVAGVDPRLVGDLGDAPHILDACVALLERLTRLVVPADLLGLVRVRDVEDQHTLGVPGDVGLGALDDHVVARVRAPRIAARVEGVRAADRVERAGQHGGLRVRVVPDAHPAPTVRRLHLDRIADVPDREVPELPHAGDQQTGGVA